jgi:hypothetical protein
MINTDMREYEYYTYGDSDAYGQPALLKTTRLGKLVLGSSRIGQVQAQNIKMAIYETSTAIQDNIAYKNATYTGLTHDSKVNDTYVIEFENKRLKVLYVKPKGRYKQVFMEAM